jgi:hypothetical protein
MNSSMLTCDRSTHLKIVFVALVAAIVVAVVGINARFGDDAGNLASAKTSGTVVKAGRPTVYSSRNGSAIR